MGSRDHTGRPSPGESLTWSHTQAPSLVQSTTTLNYTTHHRPTLQTTRVKNPIASATIITCSLFPLHTKVREKHAINSSKKSRPPKRKKMCGWFRIIDLVGPLFFSTSYLVGPILNPHLIRAHACRPIWWMGNMDQKRRGFLYVVLIKAPVEYFKCHQFHTKSLSLWLRVRCWFW